MSSIAIIENSPGLAEYFTKFMEPKEYEIFPVWKTPALPIDTFDSYLFTGDFNNISDGLLPIHEAEVKFVKSIDLDNKKLFGSCFFHQLLGVIFGGTVHKREERFLGWYKMGIDKEHQIFKGLNEPYFLNLNVDELVTPPATAKILATNPGCTYQVLQFGENILGCQSHPEILKQEGLVAIAEHRESLLNHCPDLDNMVAHTQYLADDEACEIFMANLLEWLRE